MPPGVLRREVLETLWSSGDSRVRDVVDHTGRKLGLILHYNTVSTVLKNLCRAGWVRRVRVPDSRSYLYSACVSPQQLDKESITKALQTLLAASHDPKSILAFLVDILAEADRNLLTEFEKKVKERRDRARSEKGNR